MMPPYVGKSWEETSVFGQNLLIAYEQLREHEEAKLVHDMIEPIIKSNGAKLI